MEEVEIWLSIPGWEGIYEISTLCRIRNFKTQKILKIQKENEACKFIVLKGKEKPTSIVIRKIFAQVFVAGYSPELELVHLNGNKKDLTISNLKWDLLSINSKIEGEIWVKIKDYENYEISNFGNVRKYGKLKNKIPQVHKQGYILITLSKNNISRTFTVHRLVALHFIPNPENKPEVNHLSGNKSNNHVSNLAWVTGSENVKHSFDTGLKRPNYNEIIDLCTFTIYESSKELESLLGMKAGYLKSTLGEKRKERVNKTGFMYLKRFIINL